MRTTPIFLLGVLSLAGCTGGAARHASGWESMDSRARLREVCRLQSMDLRGEDERPMVVAYLQEGAGPLRVALSGLAEGAAGIPLAACLERLGKDRAHPLSGAAIEELLKDGACVWRIRAASLLGVRKGDPFAVARLHRLAVCDPDGAVARSAILALGRVGDPAARDALRCVWRGSQVPGALRSAAAEALCGLGDRDAHRWLAAMRSAGTSAIAADGAVIDDGAVMDREFAGPRVW